MLGNAEWTFTSPESTDIAAVCAAIAEGTVSVAGKPIGFLATVDPYENYRLHLEWRWTGDPGNGGVLLNISSDAKDREWPTCIQVQLKNSRAGDLLPMAGASFAELPTPEAKELPRSEADSEKTVGQWNTCEVQCHQESITCSINGVPQNAATHITPASGRIGIQLEGTPFELRNLKITPLRQASSPGE